jgi:hypothetical protein
LDAQLVNRAIAEGGCERLIDESVLLEQREAVEARARDRDLEVIAAACAVLDVDLRAWKCLFEQTRNSIDRH